MRTARILMLGLSLLAGLPLHAQFGKSIPIKAGTPEDKALAEIAATTDPAQKLALINKFAEELGKGDMEIVADDLCENYYFSVKDYEKGFSYGEKLWALDPENFANGVNLVRAAQEKNDLNRLFQYGEKTGAIVQRFRAQPVPEGRDAAAWEQQKTQSLADIRENLSYVEQSLFITAYKSSNPADRAAYLERFAAAFPDSGYALQAQEIAATSYQQAQQYPKMLDAANKLLAKDPNDRAMLILLADYFSEKGEQLDKAEACANKAIQLVSAAKKPGNLTDEQWAKQSSLEKGIALSALGQVNIQKKNNAQAVENLRAAAPLLKSDAFTFARNQYRLGFALLNLKRVAEARVALTEAASVASPYQGPAKEKLNSLPPGPARSTKKK